MSPRTVGRWKQRTQQIYPAETSAVLAALIHHGDTLKGRDILWFVDNEGTCTTLIRGAHQEDDVSNNR